MTPGGVSQRVAREIHPIAVRQARERVILQVSIILTFVVLGAAGGFRRDMMFYVGMFAVGVVSMVYDFRWWRWVRQADPVDAYARLQARTAQEGGAARQWLTVAISVVALATWWFLGRIE